MTTTKTAKASPVSTAKRGPQRFHVLEFCETRSLCEVAKEKDPMGFGFSVETMQNWLHETAAGKVASGDEDFQCWLDFSHTELPEVIERMIAELVVAGIFQAYAPPPEELFSLTKRLLPGRRR